MKKPGIVFPRDVCQLSNVVQDIFLGLSLARQPKGSSQRVAAHVLNVKDLAAFLPSRGNLQIVDVPVAAQVERFRLQVGDVVVSARGVVKVAVVDQEQAGALAGANLIVIRPGPRLSSVLVHSFLQNPSTLMKLEQLSAGTTVSSLTASAVGSLQVVVPQAEVQLKLTRFIATAREHYVAAHRAMEIRLQVAHETAMAELSL